MLIWGELSVRKGCFAKQQGGGCWGEQALGGGELGDHAKGGLLLHVIWSRVCDGWCL